MLNFFLVFLVCLLIGILVGFPVLKACKKLHLSQTILHYVDKHSSKAGTPTMGGFIFLLAMCGAVIFFSGDIMPALFVLIITFAYALLGFLDDFIKVRFRKNEGLKPYQKIIGQVGISLAVGLYIYFTMGGVVDLFGLQLNFGWGIVPFIVVFYVAVTNSVNLTDGLDGLAGSVSMIYLLFFGCVLVVLGGFYNLSMIAFALAGGLVGFLLFNGYPAKIFMGDTGSLGLGGAIASLAVFTGQEFIMPIIGIMFVLSAVSDILQVAYYKKTHKRIFKMAPLHHHFEKKGVHENRIVLCYSVITLVCGLAVLLGELAVKGVL